MWGRIAVSGITEADQLAVCHLTSGQPQRSYEAKQNSLNHKSKSDSPSMIQVTLCLKGLTVSSFECRITVGLLH